MFKLYRNYHASQMRWVRKHPVQWIILNVILTVLFVGYIQYYERKMEREIRNAVLTAE